MASLSSQISSLQRNLKSANSQNSSLQAQLSTLRSQPTPSVSHNYQNDVEKIISDLFYSEEGNIKFSIGLETNSGYISAGNQHIRNIQFPTYQSGITYIGSSEMLSLPISYHTPFRKMYITGNYKFVLPENFVNPSDYALNLYRDDTLVKTFNPDATTQNSNFQSVTELTLTIDRSGGEDPSERRKKTGNVNFNWTSTPSAAGTSATISSGAYRLELVNQQNQVLSIKTFNVTR